jgi:hypothetical protein
MDASNRTFIVEESLSQNQEAQPKNFNDTFGKHEGYIEEPIEKPVNTKRKGLKKHKTRKLTTSQCAA